MRKCRCSAIENTVSTSQSKITRHEKGRKSDHKENDQET